MKPTRLGVLLNPNQAKKYLFILRFLNMEVIDLQHITKEVPYESVPKAENTTFST
jgi:hypothetical protein